MTIEQIKEASGSNFANAQKFSEPLNETCRKYEINIPIRQLCFLAQVGHESGGLFFTEELASGQNYEGRLDLGNTQPGDGKRFKGRGLIQITGRANYKTLSDTFGIDFIANPSLLGGKNSNNCTPDQMKNATFSAGWFWHSRNLNAIADKIDITLPIDNGNNLEQFKKMTRKINGGHNGLDDRIRRYNAGVSSFKEIIPT